MVTGEDMKQKKLKTREEVLDDFTTKGISIRSWAIKNGFSPSIVRHVLSGKLKGRIGKSHNVAVKLGLKAGKLFRGL